MAKKTFIFFCVIYSLTLLSLFLYSFTQVDLNLTISNNFVFQQIQKQFGYIGYYLRPISTMIYLILIILLFGFYIYILRRIAKKNISLHQIIVLISLTIIFLFLSYPAFSYDIFNYLFDARIFTKYGLNTYHFRALDFPDDPWIRFMHWTHRTYPYGPVWLILTIPFSYLGLQKFLLTLFLFKSIIVGSFIGSIYYIFKIVKKIFPGEELLATALFALNPLVIIETTVSPHNDIVMTLFALAAMYALISKKFFLSIILVTISIMIKFTTVGLILPWLYVIICKFLKKEISGKIFFNLALIGMIGSLFIVISRAEIQPWYILWVLPFLFLVKKPLFRTLFIIPLTFGLLSLYAPFLYLGNWDPPVPMIKLYLTSISLLIGCLLVITSWANKSRLPNKKHQLGT